MNSELSTFNPQCVGKNMHIHGENHPLNHILSYLRNKPTHTKNSDTRFTISQHVNIAGIIKLNHLLYINANFLVYTDGKIA